MGERIANHRCQVCRHPERWRVELLRAGGASLDALADKFGLDRDAIWRHWSKHVPDETKATYLCGPAQSAELAEKAASEGDSVLDVDALGHRAQFASNAGDRLEHRREPVGNVSDATRISRLVRCRELSCQDGAHHPQMIRFAFAPNASGGPMHKVYEARCRAASQSSARCARSLAASGEQIAKPRVAAVWRGAVCNAA